MVAFIFNACAESNNDTGIALIEPAGIHYRPARNCPEGYPRGPARQSTGNDEVSAKKG
jgi:hypothetical protein